MAIGLGFAFFLSAVPVLGQTAVDPGISLLQCVQTGLEHAPAILNERQSVRISEASLSQAKSWYDPSLTLSSGYRKVARFILNEGNLHSVSSSLALTQRLPSGITVAPSLELDRSDTNLEGSIASTGASAGMSITVPLFRGLGSSNRYRTTRVAAEQSLEAERKVLVTSIATSTYATASAYWGYVYACNQLDLAHILTESAESQLKATRALAEADQIALFMVDQADAYLQQSKASEISAALSVEQSWHALILSMGLDLQVQPVPAKPSDAFPVPEGGFLAALPSLDSLQAAALRNRSDLHAGALDTASAATVLEGYRNERKPHISLTLWGGYSGASTGDAFSDYFTAVNHNIPGISLSASLSWAIDIGNRSNQAAYISKLALLEQNRIREAALQRSIRSEIATALSSVRNAATLYKLNLVSAEAYKRLKDGEMKKFKMGLSDIFNLQIASNNLFSAEMQLLAAKKSFAQSILDLRLATGSLVDVVDGSVTIGPANLIALPGNKGERP